jgi:hypothetical protein
MPDLITADLDEASNGTQTAGFDEYCSLMSQGREAPPGIDAFGCLCSLRARSALSRIR